MSDEEDMDMLERQLKAMRMVVLPRYGKAFFLARDMLQQLGAMEILRAWDRLSPEDRDVLLDYAKQLGVK